MKLLNDLQKGIIDTVDVVVDSKVSRLNIPQTYVGVVVQDPEGYKCIVEINKVERTCTLPEHLHNWISKDDIVYVQDAMGNGQEWVVTGSSGSTRKQTMVISNNQEGKGDLVSGVTKFADDNGNLTDNDFVIN